MDSHYVWWLIMHVRDQSSLISDLHSIYIAYYRSSTVLVKWEDQKLGYNIFLRVKQGRASLFASEYISIQRISARPEIMIWVSITCIFVVVLVVFWYVFTNLSELRRATMVQYQNVKRWQRIRDRLDSGTQLVSDVTFSKVFKSKTAFPTSIPKPL